MTIINSVIKGKQPVIDTLNVTPTTSPQQITAPQGTDGYSPVNVSAVTSSIDANIVAGNIKKDVQILGVTGSYQGGGGSPYCIEYTKDENNVLRRGSSVIDLTGVTEVPECVLQYSYYTNTNISGNLDFSDVTTVGQYAFQYAFSGCTGITGVDFSNLITAENNAFQYAFQNCRLLTNVDFSNLTVVGNNAFYSAFYDCRSLTSVNLSNVLSCYSYAFYNAFANTSISSLSFNNLAYQTTVGDTTFYAMLYGVTGCTVHFPADWQNEVSSWTSFTYGFGGTNTTILFDLPAVTSFDFSSFTSFSDIPIALNNTIFPHVTNIDLSGITSSVGGDALFNGNLYVQTVDLSGLTQITNQVSMMFSDCAALTSVDLSSLTTINARNGGVNMFQNCPSLTSVNLRNLGNLGSEYCCKTMFNNCPLLKSLYLPSFVSFDNLTSRLILCSSLNTSLEVLDLRNLRYVGDYSILDSICYLTNNIRVVNLNALEHIGTNGARTMLYTTSVTTGISDIYFPMLTSFGTDPFYSNAFFNKGNLTIHFRRDMQSTITSMSGYSTLWGAASGTSAVFDLAGTLTGADTNSYTRSEKDSVYASETAGAAKTATAWSYNNTLYYTSGGTEPQVGDTIYSDSACTTAVTTVDSIS